MEKNISMAKLCVSPEAFLPRSLLARVTSRVLSILDLSIVDAIRKFLVLKFSISRAARSHVLTAQAIRAFNPSEQTRLCVDHLLS